MEKPGAEAPGPGEAQGEATAEVPGRRIPLPLALLLAAALLVGLVAVLGEVEAWRRAPIPEVARRGPADGRIAPGNRVDFITLGMPIQDVEAVLGKGKVRPRRDSVLYMFDAAGVHCAAREGRVESVLVHNPNLATRDGLRVGSDVDQVIRTFGDRYEYESRAEKDYTLHYWAQGIHFSVKNSAVTGILVANPVIQ